MTKFAGDERGGKSEYLLGANAEELERLRFQHGVWKPVTDRFLDRLGVGPGWRCLDVGAGPGFVTFDLRERVGKEGGVVALEPSPMYAGWLGAEIRRRGLTSVECLQSRVEDAVLPAAQFDLIYARWVMSFVTDHEAFLRPLVAALRPGGIIAVQDYYYEGLSLFPRGGAFDRMPDTVRAYYRGGGGDPYVAGALPGAFRRLGLSVMEFHPVSLAGGPESGVMEWAHRFFTVHVHFMVEKGVLSRADGDAVLADWAAHRSNPDALFFAPIVVDVAGRKPE
jgi:SAM-dependent methyltransferase